MKIFQFFYTILALGTIIPFPIELESFSEIQLKKEASEYSYQYTNPNSDSEKTPYIFIKIEDNEKIKLKIYFNEEEINFTQPSINEWINIPININITKVNITLKINTQQNDLKILFIDSSKILNLSLIKFLDLNFNTNMLYNKPYPLYFNITVDKNIYFSVQEEINYMIFDDKNLLSYCKIEENINCTYIGANNVQLIKDKTYKFKLNCYEDNNVYFFKKIKILYFIEEIFFKNNSFTINDFTENNYLILNVVEPRRIPFYMDSNSELLSKHIKLKFIPRNEFYNIIGNNFNKNINFDENGFLLGDNGIEYRNMGGISIVSNSEINEFLLIKIYKLNYIDDINNKREKRNGFILVFSEIYDFYNWGKKGYLSLNINQGRQILIEIQDSKNIFLLSSNKNMKILFQSKNDFTNKIVGNIGRRYIYIDSSKNNTKFIYKVFTGNKYQYNNTFINEYDLENLLEQNNKNNFFVRKTFNIYESGFYQYYFFDIKENYYIYTKKYFSRNNLYKYKKHLDIDVIDQYAKQNKFPEPIYNHDEKNYEIINNKLIILSGTQLFDYYLNYGTFFDLFIQKVNDFDYIDVNIEVNKYSRNIVRLLNKEKLYYIKFELNHLIKLDNNFLDADVTFINNNGTKYLLNKKNKIIYLKGNNFMVISNIISIIYFYEKIKNYNENSIIDFDKSKTGKNMKINIVNKNEYDIKIAIAKDFGFKNYYPMLNYQDLEIITIQGKNSNLIYIENYYDLLELNIYESENEKYYIYLFEIQENNRLNLLNNEKIEISFPIYFDSITKLSKYNFNMIPNNNTTLILKCPNKFEINYYFAKCSSDDIIFKLKAIDDKGNYTIEEKQINNQKYLDIKFERGQTLLHHFDSNSKFLFLFDFSYKNDSIKYCYYNYFEIENHGIKYLNLNKKNILSIGFIPAIDQNLIEYYIVIARKNEINNLYTFSDPCHITNLIMSKSEQICFKRVYHYERHLFFEDFDISKIKKDNNDEYVINIISYNMNIFKHLMIFIPVIYNDEIKRKNAIKLTNLGIINLRPEKDYFIFDHLTNDIIILEFYTYNDLDMILTYNNENRIQYYFEHRTNNHRIIFKKKGIYYLEFFYHKNYFRHNYYFVWKLDNMFKQIDLSKDIYSGISINDIIVYKISKLKEDKKVYFTFENNYREEYDSNSPFRICKNENDDCKDNIFSYKFLKRNEYTIYIGGSHKYFYYNFFPVLNNTIINNANEGHYIIESPKILYLEKNKQYIFINIILYSISSYNINKYSSYHILNNLRIYSYELEDSKYDTYILIPEKKDKISQFFITNKRFDDATKFYISKGQNAIIEIDNFDNNYYESKSFENYFSTYTSSVENLRFISFEKNDYIQNKKFIYNYFGKKLLYVDKYNGNDILIKKNIYDPKYLLFAILNDETINYFNSFAESKNIYINSRINTDKILINDYINIYIDKFDKKYNLYIKKYYGSIRLYESKYVLNNISNIDILTKPIKNIIDKKSIFNRLIHINQNQLFTGYISSNSLLDIYLEEDNNNKDIYLSDFKNRKYLKKDIEYQFHFNLNHLIKLESQFDAEVIVYNDHMKIKINKKNQTGILIGDNFKIISNDNVMVYFYPKTEKFQRRIEPNKGDIIEILYTSENLVNYSIDFGFEGFEPPPKRVKFQRRIEPSKGDIYEINKEEDPQNSLNYFNGSLYLENLYDKLDIKLAPGEYLYLYYQVFNEDLFEINYINNNIISSAYNFNFFLVKNNNNIEKNKFIVPYINRKETKLRIYHCKSPYKINIRYNSPLFKSKTEFSGDIVEENYFFKDDNAIYNFSYKAKNDFIISYFYDDIKEKYMYGKWKKERIMKNTNLTINEIKILNKKEIYIKFNANYKYSLTKYIIIITPEEKNNTLENLKNICFLTELINQKEGHFFIEETYDIGENDIIEAFIEISKLKSYSNKYIVNIISEELRFKKLIMFYEPKYFYIVESGSDIKLNNALNIKQIILFFGIIFVLIFILFYFKNAYLKINSKKRKNIFNENNENLGVELNDYNNLYQTKNK